MLVEKVYIIKIYNLHIVKNEGHKDTYRTINKKLRNQRVRKIRGMCKSLGVYKKQGAKFGLVARKRGE